MKSRISIGYIFIIILCFCSINSWSYWIDESSTMYWASFPTIKDMFLNIWASPGSENQMPGYVIFMWGWSKLFGLSEYALRSSNLLFVSILLGYSFYILKDTKLSDRYKKYLLTALCLTFISPFILYNMNEARANIAIFCFGFINIISIYNYTTYKQNKDWYIFLFFFLLGYSFNMLYAFICPPLLIILLKKIRLTQLIKEQKYSILLTLFLFITISSYYIFTLIQGKGGAIETPGLKNITYTLYEFAGFGGLGPSKNTIRESTYAISEVKPYIINLLLLSLSYIVLIILYIKNKQKKKKYHIFLLLIISLSCFFCAAYIVHFRFWGRHLFMLYPLWILFMTQIVRTTWNDGKFNKIIICLFISTLLYSSYRIMFSPIYKKENIKHSIEMTNFINRENSIVYFSEADALARFYQLKNYKLLQYIDDNSAGLLLWFKRVAPMSENPVLNTNKYKAKIIYSDKDSELYRFEPLNK